MEVLLIVVLEVIYSATYLNKSKVMRDTIYYLIIVIYYFWYFYVKNVILGLGDLFPYF